MSSQIALFFAISIAVTGCANNLKAELKSNFINIKSSNYPQQISQNKTIKSKNNFQESLIFVQYASSDLKDISARKNTAISYNSPSSNYKNYMTLSRTRKTNNLNNPLYKLTLFVNGKLISSHLSVSGRNYTQNRDRHVSDTEAPLPNGIYKVAQHHIPGTHPEVGGQFLPIYPQFSTGRSALGIHYDPSFDKSVKDDGTAGCIALTNRDELDIVLEYVRNHQPEFLDVQI